VPREVALPVVVGVTHVSWLLDSLVEATVAWGAAHESSTPQYSKLLFDSMSRLMSRLRRSPDEREILRTMIDNENPWCRLIGATFLWRLDRDAALAAVEALQVDRNRDVAFDAMQTAKQMRAGTLDLDWVSRVEPAEPPGSEPGRVE
jgi:hypothetical protein